MLEGYDKSEEAMMLRYQKLKEEYEEGIKLLAAEEKGIAKGKAEGKEESIRTMSANGASNEMISKLLNLDINYVNEVLKTK